MRLNTEKKTLLILTIFGLVTFGITAGIIYPTVYQIKTLNKETEDLRQYLEKKFESTQSLRTSKQKIDEMRLASSEYENYLFYRGNELKLITELEALATNNNLTQKINSSDLDKPVGNAIHFSLTLSGDYKNSLNYLNALEKSNYFFIIKNIQITSAFSPQNSNPNAITMNLDILLYASK